MAKAKAKEASSGKWKDPMQLSASGGNLKMALKRGSAADVRTTIGDTVRILCLLVRVHTKDLLVLSLGPLRSEASRLGKVKLELIFANSPHITGLEAWADEARRGRRAA